MTRIIGNRTAVIGAALAHGEADALAVDGEAIIIRAELEIPDISLDRMLEVEPDGRTPRQRRRYWEKKKPRKLFRP